ncbi:hypothetical protein TNCV_3352051 [Trichonephila clavipes]|nr:hypothetical protein TNCV_3352051 [Trichonephila clavipes]
MGGLMDPQTGSTTSAVVDDVPSVQERDSGAGCVGPYAAVHAALSVDTRRLSHHCCTCAAIVRLSLGYF